MKANREHALQLNKGVLWISLVGLPNYLDKIQLWAALSQDAHMLSRPRA
ncbi:hypothetical protein COMA2_80083 [Candidatus Nitrospira nitrificans]|uniref:Uncharacterized protein n=1 Tax=Candidatus Nitrospira nitrificans TaxID=1742973 RepID=A0A0S4LPW2_9BACT|nr:hypothetical protein COMA2_80083 [Candidatus Nitrospira nitrificans]